jgi:hypothetical protein
MSKKLEEKIDVFRRTLERNGFRDLAEMEDEDLERLLASAVLPLSMDTNFLKYAVFSFGALTSNAEIDRIKPSLQKIESAGKMLTKQEKVLYRFLLR